MLGKPPKQVRAVQALPDGRLASASQDHTAKLWAPKDGMSEQGAGGVYYDIGGELGGGKGGVYFPGWCYA